MTIYKDTYNYSLLFFLRFIPILFFLFLTACGGGGNKNSNNNSNNNNNLVTSSRYSNYMSNHPEWRPPGPSSDPWGPYISQSSQRFNIPNKWIRAVIMQESRGYQYYNNRPITSHHGAKGLMQLKTPTYNDMAKRYKLGKDPYEPRDNIMAGTAYIRILYNQFGAPGFVAAYHGGPGTLGNHLNRGGSLSPETRKYLAVVSQNLGNDVPMSGPFVKYASKSSKRVNTKKPLPLEAYYNPKSYTPVTMVAQNTTQPKKKKNTTIANNYQPMKPLYPTKKQQVTPNVIQVAYVPDKNVKGNWGVQVGAYSSANLAQQATSKAQENANGTLSSANQSIQVINKNGSNLYRARLTGVNQIAAIQACQNLKQKGMNCVTVQ